jgi:hypothetical protein
MTKRLHITKPAGYFLFGFGAVALLLVLWLPAWAQTGAIQGNGETPREVIARINQWRLSQGLWPLQESAALNGLAQAQAAYLAGLSALPEGEALHFGPSGEVPARRAVASPYLWPSYGRVERTNIGEIAAVGSVNFAMGFWGSSSIHARTALNPSYREIGAAMWPTREGVLSIVVFGSRPGVMPVLVNPVENVLYLTNERYRFKSGGAWLQDATQIRVLDAVTGKLYSDGAISWAGTFRIPAGASDKLIIEFTGAGIPTTTEVDLLRDLVVLPGVAPAAPRPTATPIPFGGEVGTLPTLAVDAIVTAVPTSTPIPTATPAATATAPVAPRLEKPDVTFYYDTQSFVLLNPSGKAINLVPMQIEGANKFIMPVERWTRAASFPIQAFPTNHCLQLILNSANVGTRAECRFVRSELQFARAQTFWTLAAFEVRYSGSLVALCPAYTSGAAARCDVDLP